MRSVLRALVAVSLLVTGIGLSAGASTASDKSWQCTASGAKETRTVVLLVHGFHSSELTWSAATAQYLASNPATCIATFDYGPYSTNWVTDPNIAYQLGRTIKKLAAHSEAGKVVIVAHSMGGLATRCAASPVCSGLDGVASDIRELVTFGTPTLGSFLRDNARSHVGNLLGPFFSLSCDAVGLDLSVPNDLCGTVRALGTSDAAKAFTPGSPQLASVSTNMSFPIEAVAGSVKLQTSFFGRSLTVTGDAGDLVVDVQSALAARNSVAGLGGEKVIDCGDLDITGIGAAISLGLGGVVAAAAYAAAYSSVRCLHTSETNDKGFLAVALHEITQIESPLASSSSAGSSRAPRLSTDGYGPLRFGMTLAEAQTALGGAIATQEAGAPGCLQGSASAAPNIVFAVVDGRVLAAGVASDSSQMVTTSSGLHVGSSLADLKARVSGLTSQPYGSAAGTTEYDLKTASGRAAAFYVDDRTEEITGFLLGDSKYVIGVEFICV